MKRDVAEFVSKYLVCRQVKSPRQKTAGMLQSLSILEWKWENIAMDFIVGLPKTLKGCTVIWVIVRLHGVPVSIVSDRDPCFTSAFWRGLQKALGIHLDFSIAFHPKIDGQTEHINQILEDVLRACVLAFRGSWDSKLHLMEISYNNSFQATIGMAPFKALYGKQCRFVLCWDKVGERELVGPKLMRVTNEAV